MLRGNVVYIESNNKISISANASEISETFQLMQITITLHPLYHLNPPNLQI